MVSELVIVLQGVAKWAFVHPFSLSVSAAAVTQSGVLSCDCPCGQSSFNYLSCCHTCMRCMHLCVCTSLWSQFTPSVTISTTNYSLRSVVSCGIIFSAVLLETSRVFSWHRSVWFTLSSIMKPDVVLWSKLYNPSKLKLVKVPPPLMVTIKHALRL